MIFSTRSEYGVMMLTDLARHYGNGPLSLTDIATHLGLSVAYLEQVWSTVSRGLEMLSTAAPDFQPGSSLFGPAERKSMTLVSGRLGGVRCGLSGPPGPSSQDWSARPSVADRGRSGRPVDVHLHPAGDGGQPTMIGSRSGHGRRRAGF